MIVIDNLLDNLEVFTHKGNERTDGIYENDIINKETKDDVGFIMVYQKDEPILYHMHLYPSREEFLNKPYDLVRYQNFDIKIENDLEQFLDAIPLLLEKKFPELYREKRINILLDLCE